jgi:hypothetical protein
MKPSFLQLICAFVFFSGFVFNSFGQYKYLGYEVYDTTSNIESLIPLDSSKSFGLTTGPINFTNNCSDFSFTIYDDPLVVAHPNTFLILNGWQIKTCTKFVRFCCFLWKLYFSWIFVKKKTIWIWFDTNYVFFG